MGRQGGAGLLGWSRDLGIRQSCGKELSPNTSASWMPSSLTRDEPVLPALPTHWAVHADLVWGRSGVTWLQGSPAPWPRLCLGTHGGQSWRCSVAHKDLSVCGELAPLLSPVLVSVLAAHTAHLSRSVKRAFVCQQSGSLPMQGLSLAPQTTLVCLHWF